MGVNAYSRRQNFLRRLKPLQGSSSNAEAARGWDIAQRQRPRFEEGGSLHLTGLPELRGLESSDNWKLGGGQIQAKGVAVAGRCEQKLQAFSRSCKRSVGRSLALCPATTRSE